MPCTTVASKKAKGRALQQTVRDAFLEIGKQFGLETGDVVSTSMGASGVDVQLSPAAKRVLGDLAVECKNRESLVVTTTFHEHQAKYPDKLAILVHKRNQTVPLITMKFSDYLVLLSRWVESHNA